MAREGAISEVRPARTEYLVHGIKVSVHCAHGEAMQWIHDHLNAYHMPGPARGADVAVDIVPGDVLYPVPLHAKRLMRYSSMRVYFLGGTIWFTDYFSTLKVEDGGRTVTGNISEKSFADWGIQFFVNVMFPLAFFEALRFHGLYYMHAAGLLDGEGRGYLISGNAGSGKTTMTLSLIHAGWKFLSDDTVFLKLGDGKDVTVLGFARDFHIPLDLVEDNNAFANLCACPDYKSYRKKKVLRPADWFPEQIMTEITNPRALVFPRIRDGEPGIEEMSGQEALGQLISQSPAVMFNPALAKEHLEAINRLARHGRAFRLWSGPELRTDPEKVKELTLAVGRKTDE